jgi:hypothetical protein
VLESDLVEAHPQCVSRDHPPAAKLGAGQLAGVDALNHNLLGAAEHLGHLGDAVDHFGSGMRIAMRSPIPGVEM